MSLVFCTCKILIWKVRFSGVFPVNSFFCSRCCRFCVCLILVCCMIVNCLAIKAEASVLGAAAVLFGDDAALAVIAACLAGLGVMANLESETDTLAFRNLCQDAYDAMAAAGEWVVDGAVTVYNCATELWDYGVDCGMVQWLHDWMFDSGVVENAWSHFSANTTYVNIHGTEVTPLCDYNIYRVRLTDTATNKQYAVELVHFINGYTFRLANGTVREATARKYGDKTYYVSINNKLYKTEFAGFHDLGYMDCSAFSAPADAAIAYLFEHYISVNASAVSTPYDLTLGTVAPPGTDIETEYGDYIVIVAPNGVPDTGGDGSGDDQPQIPIIPIPVLPSYEETIQLPQEDIWKGNKVETEDPDTGGSTDPSTGTDTDDPDSGSNDPTTPTIGTDNPDSPGDDGSQDVPLTPDQLQPYVFDLRDFFPFCIPFDLYDFFQLFDADPVAPVFHWEIQDLAGNVYPIDIDLSAWDSTALFFRRLQLLVFTVGLAMASRKFIKW